jgi:hypothetical protein
LYFVFSIPCGFLYEHVEIFVVLSNIQALNRISNIILK